MNIINITICFFAIFLFSGCCSLHEETIYSEEVDVRDEIEKQLDKWGSWYSSGGARIVPLEPPHIDIEQYPLSMLDIDRIDVQLIGLFVNVNNGIDSLVLGASDRKGGKWLLVLSSRKSVIEPYSFSWPAIVAKEKTEQVITDFPENIGFGMDTLYLSMITDLGFRSVVVYGDGSEKNALLNAFLLEVRRIAYEIQ